MHARVSVFQVTPDELDAFVEYGRGAIAGMMEMEGFRGRWESEEAIEASEERANAMRSSGDSAIYAGVVSVDRCEVGYFVQP